MAKGKAARARRHVTIGLDISDRKTEVCVLLGDGAMERPAAVRTLPDAFRKFFERPKAHVVLEVGTHSGWIARLAGEAGHEVTVANPRRVKLISQSDAKCDRSDAELLARLGAADRTLLAPVEHRSAAAQVELATPKARDVLVASRTRLINHIRGTAKSFGYRLPKCDARVFARKAQIPHELMPAMRPLLEVLSAIEAQIHALDRQIGQIAERHPDVEVLTQINGVGALTALVYILTLGMKTRFTKSRTVGAYLGLQPRRDQSGDSDKQLGITKAGNSMLRRLLVNCANYILGPFAKDSDLRSWGLKLCARGGRNARRRAKVAVARKLAVMMHRLWLTGEEYKPIGYRVAA